MPFLLFCKGRKCHGDETNLWELFILLLSKIAGKLEPETSRKHRIIKSQLFSIHQTFFFQLWDYKCCVTEAVWAMIWMSKENSHSSKLKAPFAWQCPALFSEFCCQSCLQARAITDWGGANPPSSLESWFHTHWNKRHYFRYIPC